MITYFPDPYPDELLYSVCARYKDIMRYCNKLDATRDFFGQIINAPVEFPNRLGYLESSLPPNHKYTVDDFIDLHTPFPFYAQFLPIQRAHLIRNDMFCGGFNRIRDKMGLMANHSYWPKWLRFCTQCVIEDRAHFGETYWHRIHQIPGVEVCPHHAVFLENSEILWWNRRNPGAVFCAEDAVVETPARSLNHSDWIHNIQLKIALLADWLLKYRGEPLGTDVLRDRYYNSSLKQGYACYSGQFQAKKLTINFAQYYSPQFLAKLGCTLANKPQHSWLMRLLAKTKTGVVQLPIRHILIIIFFGYSPEEFFTSFVEYKPFGDGPWPCLNPASDHYKQPQVTSCRIGQANKKLVGRPMGTFSCDCGFRYTRSGPDQTKEDRYKLSSVQSYGHVWEETLRELWADNSRSRVEISRELRVAPLTVTRRGISLGLTYPRESTSAQPTTKIIHDRLKILSLSFQERVESKRQKLLVLINANPQATRNELKYLSSYLLTWLRRHDLQWLEDHLPPIMKGKPGPRVADWQQRDYDTSEAIKDAALDIKNMEGSPIRVTKTALMDKIGRRVLIERRLNRLPLTAKALKKHVESREDFLLRKIEWVSYCFRKEGMLPSPSRLVRRIGVQHWIAKSERVRKAVDEALLSLR